MIGKMKVDYRHIKKGDLVDVFSVDYEGKMASVIVDRIYRDVFRDFSFDEVELIEDEVYTVFGMSKRKKEWEQCLSELQNTSKA